MIQRVEIVLSTSMILHLPCLGEEIDTHMHIGLVSGVHSCLDLAQKYTLQLYALTFKE